MRPLRLCYIANPNSPHTVRAVQPFIERGHRVYLIADRPVHRAWQGATLFDFGGSFRGRVPKLGLLPWAVKVRAVVHDLCPDVLHAHQVDRGGWISLATRCHPLVLTAWGSDLLVQAGRSPLHWALSRAALRRADLVLTPAKPIFRRALALGGDAERVRLMPWGVDMQAFRPGSASAALRVQLGVPENASVVLSPRALAPIYNIDVILEAMALVTREVPNALLLITEYNPRLSYRLRIARMIERLGLGSTARLIQPAETPAQMADLCRLADVIVSVPSSDSLALTVSEAMACGAAVTISDLPAFDGWVEPERSGLVVPVRDVGATAGAITRLLKDAALRRDIGKRAAQKVREQADQTAWVEQMEALYYELAG
jgi:glycosyltransferase involved in cell wall biosynthesis